MEHTIERLLQQAYLFDDPRAYQAGVRDAVEAMRPRLDVARETAITDGSRVGEAAGARSVDPRERRSA